MSTEAPATPITPATDQAAQAAPPAEKKRDAYFSNAKLVLIVLVVCGHAWSPLIGESHSVRAVYMTLYAFHMPAFILLCGYFSRSFTGRPDQVRRVLTGIVAPYVIFSGLYGVLRIWIDGHFSWSLLYPYYLTWFLAALFVWRVTSPIWRIVKYPVVVATLISVGALMMDLPGVFDLGRILQFLPFFVAGMFLRREHFELLKRPVFKYGGLVLTAGILALAFRFGGDLNTNWIYFNEGAGQMDVSRTAALPIKLTLMAAAVVLLITFFAWIPDRTLRISRLGEATMYTFLLHGFVTRGASYVFGWYDNAFVHTALGAVTVTLLAILTAFLLMSPPVRWLTRPLVEPRLDWLLRKPERRQSRGEVETRGGRGREVTA
ncbi:fucose 4-O-acetylase-like acetyltransferase [Stackebrandtia albiflava]|uniref:Fucose 4-O-acetylase-like acetyltransferase n=1 Tax=Stackebrandtia albiflava TaxID=406432 RepID=A0A562UQM5_9ACTN|nr:acyltransferase family protein [Stackebrandtia albiflava]TWJ07919.1 fucose 4-O-acetylase-like acetyltransferase [Stackebrandtia albiflava]